MSDPPRQSHKDLIVWQKAIDLAIVLHESTRDLPQQERFGLATQIRRAAISIPSNIAEGAARRTTRDFLAFMHVARGSLAEVETQLLVAGRLGYFSSAVHAELAQRSDEVGRLINGVIAGLQRRQSERRSTV
jgi:four helix bundle protein